MKKLIALLCVVIAMATLLTACSFTCDSCGQESDGEKFTHEEDGKEIVLCETCEGLYQLGKSMQAALG